MQQQRFSMDGKTDEATLFISMYELFSPYFFNYVLHPAGGGISCWYLTFAQTDSVQYRYSSSWGFYSFLVLHTVSIRTDKGCRFRLCRHDDLILFLLVFRLKIIFKIMSPPFFINRQWSGLILKSMYPTHCKDLKHTKLPIPFLLHDMGLSSGCVKLCI